MATTSSMLHLIAKLSLLKKLKNRIYMDKNLTCTAFVPKKDIYIYIYIFFFFLKLRLPLLSVFVNFGSKFCMSIVKVLTSFQIFDQFCK